MQMYQHTLWRPHKYFEVGTNEIGLDKWFTVKGQCTDVRELLWILCIVYCSLAAFGFCVYCSHVEILCTAPWLRSNSMYTAPMLGFGSLLLGALGVCVLLAALSNGDG